MSRVALLRIAETALACAKPAPATAVAAEGRVGRVRLRLECGRRRAGGRAGRARSPRRRLVVGVVHAQPPAAQLERVAPTNGVSGARGVRELCEREAAGTSRDAIRADADTHARVDLDENAAQLLLGGLERQVADEDRGRNGLLL